ncbi:hypothetical protein ASPWEDRAFT_23597 [Aspergillus wentii DTO 134E9]|uniref:Uncharacterized protein n=1 Tax=Aspergillus wentii DTO 134E9 TaxID=1073089 RepID=A0A1L9S2X4_ASPWE|nr:uncharacterized protein ASPWEDRAFT_23597 [Aspergillus wentii DTO 134E9]KAI9929864.1 hypothetical protein MW887_011670 [Aspergillus wentii]OJJ41515.1 hypothetical protein ASPWEDRAFT_23597 [Aspergillus wentii DTO 134E9]
MNCHRIGSEGSKVSNSYPQIPPESIGQNNFPARSSLREIHTVHRTDSLESSKGDINSRNRLIRTHHRSLSICEAVYITTTPDGREIWSVGGLSSPMLDTHAGGLEIHMHPIFHSPPPNKSFDTGYIEDPIPREINPRRFLRESDMAILREKFPLSVAVRVFISGFIVILFESREKMEQSWESGVATEFGNLRLRYDTVYHEHCANDLQSGTPVTTGPGRLEKSAALGLKLKLKNGDQCITVPTHAFMKVYTANSHSRLLFADWIAKSKEAVQKYMGITIKTFSNSPLGKDVWIAGSNQRIGKITVTYDSPASHVISFPYGFAHDLSLVTDDRLPKMIRRSDVPPITEWGSYNEALDGGPVFVTGFYVATGNPKQLQGNGISRGTQKAIVEGTAYIWNRKGCDGSVALFWRTVDDRDSIEHLSGSVLCRGQLGDQACAVCFQNFETPVPSAVLHNDYTGRKPYNVQQFTVKGGFLLPPEIRCAEIIDDQG